MDALERRALPLALALFAAQMLFYLPYLTDDTFIYVRFAENLARHGELAFNPGEPVHAATSPLWAAWGAVGVWLGVGAYAWLKVWGMLFGAASLVFVARAAREHLDRRWAALVVVAFACEPWFVRWSASGMETALGVFLFACAIDAGWRPPSRVRWSRLGWATGLMPLVRPETLLLLGLVALAALRSSTARRRVGLWAGLVLPVLAWAGIALPLYGHVLPATLQAKSTPLGLQPKRLAFNLARLGTLYALAGVVASVGWLAGAAAAWRTLRQRAPRAFLTPVLWAWTWLLPLVYLLRDVEVVSRYLETVLVAVFLLGAVFASRSTHPGAWRVAWLAQVAVALGLCFAWIGPSARDFGRTLDQGLGEVATWIRENTASDAEVAIYDIGVVGARSGRTILDLGGLVHPGLNDLRNRVDDAEILHEGLFLDFLEPGRPWVLVDRDAAPDALDGQVLGGRVRCRAQLSVRVANLGLSRSEPVVYTVYRLDPVPVDRP